jgi:hypothetical protein
MFKHPLFVRRVAPIALAFGVLTTMMVGATPRAAGAQAPEADLALESSIVQCGTMSDAQRDQCLAELALRHQTLEPCDAVPTSACRAAVGRLSRAEQK